MEQVDNMKEHIGNVSRKMETLRKKNQNKMLGIKNIVINDLPRFTQDEIENQNRSITHNEIELVIKKRPTNQDPGPDFAVEL